MHLFLTTLVSNCFAKAAVKLSLLNLNDGKKMRRQNIQEIKQHDSAEHVIVTAQVCAGGYITTHLSKSTKGKSEKAAVT